MENKDRIAELEAEITRLKTEIEKSKEQLRDLEDSRKAMLYILEDMNRSSAEIERSRKEWETTFEAITDPIFIHDDDFRIVRANSAYEKLADMPMDEIKGKTYFEIFPKMDGPHKMCLKAKKLQEEEEEEEVYLPYIDKTFKVRFYSIRDPEGKHQFSVHYMEDITQIKKAEEKLKLEMDVTKHLLMISEATSDTTNLDRLMQEVVHCVSRIMGSGVSGSFLWDSNEGVFKPHQSYGLSAEMIPLFLTTPLEEDLEFVKKAIISEELLIINLKDEMKDQVLKTENNKLLTTDHELKRIVSKFPWMEDFSIISVIALSGKTGNLGLIINGYKESKIFTEKDRRLATGIIKSTSLALEESRLYRDSIEKTIELANKIETIQVMSEIDRGILSTLKSDVMLETAIMSIPRIVPCDRATVAIVDKAMGWFVYKAGFGITTLKKGDVVPFKDTSATEIVMTGRPQYMPNIKTLRVILPLEKKLLEEGFLSHIRVPLTVKGEVIGTLNIGSKRPAAFSSEDLSTLEKIASQISVALENARLVTDLQELFLGTVKSLSSAIDAKSPWTAGHSERVTSYALGIGKEMGLSEKDLYDLELAGLLHDIGKIGTYESILNKSEKLTDEEFALIKQHPVKGAEMLKPIKQLKDIIPAIKHHHEFYDGNGYPDGLKGEEIPFYARILAIADTFDAMKADRPYRKGRTEEFILEEFKKCSGTQFDPKIIEAFQGVLKKI